MDSFEAKFPKTVGFYKKNQQVLDYLYGRWLDEREYEDIKEYADLIRGKIEAEGMKMGKMRKRPFGFEITNEEGTFRLEWKSRSFGIVKIK